MSYAVKILSRRKGNPMHEIGVLKRVQGEFVMCVNKCSDLLFVCLFVCLFFASLLACSFLNLTRSLQATQILSSWLTYSPTSYIFTLWWNCWKEVKRAFFFFFWYTNVLSSFPPYLFILFLFQPWKGELLDRIKKKTKFSEAEARHYFTTIVETVAYLHRAGIVHRDLKVDFYNNNFRETEALNPI